MSYTPPVTTLALQRALLGETDQARRDELTALERWERDPSPDLGAMFRIRQLRRANPAVAAAIRAELDRTQRFSC